MKTKKKATTYDESHKVPENLYYPKLSKHQLNKKKSFTHNE